MPVPAVARCLERLIGPAHSRTLVQFLRFGVVGTLGFLVDTAVLYLGLALGLGLYLGRAISYLAAASANWALNATSCSCGVEKFRLKSRPHSPIATTCGSPARV